MHVAGLYFQKKLHSQVMNMVSLVCTVLRKPRRNKKQLYVCVNHKYWQQNANSSKLEFCNEIYKNPRRRVFCLHKNHNSNKTLTNPLPRTSFFSKQDC